VPQLGDGESVITRAGERLGAGWVRVVRSGAAKQGALLREKEIQSLRAEIEDLQKREAVLNETLTRLRDQALAAEQQREDAQRALYLAHRACRNSPASCRASRASWIRRATASNASTPTFRS
jgi:chromosome segregation protein